MENLMYLAAVAFLWLNPCSFPLLHLAGTLPQIVRVACIRRDRTRQATQNTPQSTSRCFKMLQADCSKDATGVPCQEL